MQATCLPRRATRAQALWPQPRAKEEEPQAAAARAPGVAVRRRGSGAAAPGRGRASPFSAHSPREAGRPSAPRRARTRPRCRPRHPSQQTRALPALPRAAACTRCSGGMPLAGAEPVLAAREGTDQNCYATNLCRRQSPTALATAAWVVPAHAVLIHLLYPVLSSSAAAAADMAETATGETHPGRHPVNHAPTWLAGQPAGRS